MADDGTLRVVQLNLGSYFEPGWKERRHETVAWLAELRPDVVCLEEVWESQSVPNTAGWVAERLHEELDGAEGEPTYHWCFGGDAFGPGRTRDPSVRFGSAVLSRWPIDAHTYHRLPTVGEDPEVDSTPWELLEVATGGLDVFACHLSPAPHHGRHRRRQVLAIDEIIRSVRRRRAAGSHGNGWRDAVPPILCGDFNAEPDSDEIRFLCGLTDLEGRATFYQDAWRVAGEGPGLTQDWRTNPIAADLNVHRKRIDYVFVGDPFLAQHGAGRVLRAEVAFDESRTGVLASDHFGLVVDLVAP